MNNRSLAARIRRFLLVMLSCLPLFGGATKAEASQFGCTVLLCLSNPSSNGGPKGVAACVPPINQLYSDLEHGDPMPTCGLADGNDGSSYAQQVYNPFDPCPSPLTAAPDGTYVVLGTTQTTQVPMASGVVSGQQACVGNVIGSYTFYEGNGGDGGGESFPVTEYDQVIWQKAQSPSAIDVYINNAFYQRVHY